MNEPRQNSRRDAHLHEAAIAWSTASEGSAEPHRLEAFQDDRFGTSGRKSLTYRLHGVGPRGGPIVAKKGDERPIGIERLVYEYIMPGLGGHALRYWGALPSPSDEMCWLFLEDAGDEALLSALPEHRIAAARWLAALHLHTADWPEPLSLPDRDTGSYGRLARRLPDLLLKSREFVALDARRTAVLDALAPLLTTLNKEWNRIDHACSHLPRVLVHGDLIDKNMRMAHNRDVGSDPSMLAIDWEMAGWGTSAVDLASSRVGEYDASLRLYYSLVAVRWPHLSPDGLKSAAGAGLVMRTVTAIEWALSSIGPLYLDRPFLQLPVYTKVLLEFLGR